MLQEATEQVSFCMTLLSIFQTCFLKQSCLSCEDGLHLFFSAIYLIWLKANICTHFTQWFRLVYISDMCFHYLQFSQPAEAALQESGRQKASTNVEKLFPTAGIYSLSYRVIVGLSSSTDMRSYLALSAVIIVVLYVRKNKDLKLFRVL